jgi:hypothetical protein
MFCYRVIIIHPKKVWLPSKNSLFMRDFHWYRVPNLSHIFLLLVSLETFNNIESKMKNWIILFTFLPIFSQYYFSILMEFHPDTTTHGSLSTRRFSILSFHNSKFWWLIYSISILEVLHIFFPIQESSAHISHSIQGLLWSQGSLFFIEWSKPSNKGVPLNLVTLLW